MIQVTLISEESAYSEPSARNWVRRAYLIQCNVPIPNKDSLWKELQKLREEGKVYYKWTLPQDILLFDDGTAIFTPYLGSMD